MQADYLNEPQQEAVRHLAHRSGIVWWKIGKGKTRIAIQLFYEHLTRCQDAIMLVVCSPAAVRQWQEEIDISPYRTALLGRWYSLSYGQLSTSSPAAPWRRTAHDHTLTFIVFDELWLYKNPRSLRAQAARTFSSQSYGLNRTIIGLSGTLISANNIEDLYGQAYAIGISQVVAKSLTDFRSQFLIAYEDFGLKFAPKKGAIKAIQERLSPYVHIYFPKDTRETRIQRLIVEPNPKQQYLFDTVSKDYYATLSPSSEIDIKSASALLTKLQQISDGAILDAEGKRIHIESSKFDRLLRLLDELSDAGEQTIVWFSFKASLDYVAAKLGEKAALLSSDHEFDYRGWRKKRYSVCLATVGSGASLNDFAHCRYAVVFSAPFSPRALAQSMGRTNRESSTHPIAHYYFLQTLNSPDPDIYTSLLASLEMQAGAIQLSTDIIRKYIQKYIHI